MLRDSGWLRDKHNYPCQFEYKKTDRLKQGIARDVIDYFVENDDLEFQALLIPTAHYDLGRYRTATETSARTPEIGEDDHRTQLGRRVRVERRPTVMHCTTLSLYTRAR